MKTVAVYNMKGGVGKTTTAVNLSYLAAASGRRTLLWDLDPQAASSYAFRVRANVPGFTKRRLEDGEALAAAIKETDYPNLYLLPADFAYRKFERFLNDFDKPERLVASLITAIGRDFDVVLLDCPAGFSLLIEGVFAAADVMLVPTIPSVLSLRMVARLIKWADHSHAPTTLAPFLSMVDRRKTLHRRACEWSSANAALLLNGLVPYASIVEQMAVRRLPLAAFAPRDPAARAFADLWHEVAALNAQRAVPDDEVQKRWPQMLCAVEALIAYLEPLDSEATPGAAAGRSAGEVCVVHRFDTEQRDLEKRGWCLELHESSGRFFVVASAVTDDRATDRSAMPKVQIDSAWAVQILAGDMSPLAALEQRLGRPGPQVVRVLSQIAGGALRRVESRVGQAPIARASWPLDRAAAVS